MFGKNTATSSDRDRVQWARAIFRQEWINRSQAFMACNQFYKIEHKRRRMMLLTISNKNRRSKQKAVTKTFIRSQTLVWSGLVWSGLVWCSEPGVRYINDGDNNSCKVFYSFETIFQVYCILLFKISCIMSLFVLCNLQYSSLCKILRNTAFRKG